MFLLIVNQEDTPWSIAKFHTVAKSLFIFNLSIYLFFGCFFVVVAFLQVCKMEKKVFWQGNSEIRLPARN